MKYAQHLKNNKHLVAAFIILVLIMVMNSFAKNTSSSSADSVEPIQVDTVIPKGYVLVPIELENKEALSSVIQNFGIIDLYSGRPEFGSSRKIAIRVKIIRAPYNPNLFAVLVKEAFAEKIMNERGSFYAVIQNKAAIEGTNETESVQTTKNIRIEYQK